jgi:chemotaxis protein methyltransferase CheR
MLGAELTGEEFETFRGLIYETAGIRIPPTKRILVSNRVRRRLRATKIDTFSGYLAYLKSAAGKDELPLFLDAITTNETYFFRDPQHYAWLGDEFLPEIARQGRLHQRPKTLRIWSAACATGEEVYSIALKIAEQKHAFGGWKISLLGTDISGAALDTAREGSYDARALRLIPNDERAAHFDLDAKAQRSVLKAAVRAMPTWKRHNLLHPLREDPFDCIFLKNVLIYFDPESKQTVVRHLLAALAKGGYLVAGPTEGVHNLLGTLIKHKTWLYQRPA